MTQIYAKQALLPDGWHHDVRVSFAGTRITAVETGRSNGTGTTPDHHVDCLLPAPSNSHSHGFQRAMAGLTEARGNTSDSFWTWRDLMYRFLGHLTPDHLQAITAFAQMEMLQAGYAACGEFHYLHHGRDGQVYDNLAEMACRVVAAAQNSGIGLTLLPVHYQFGGCDGRALHGGQLRFGNDLDRYSKLYSYADSAMSELADDSAIGIAPHSPRAISSSYLRLYPTMTNGPIHLHFAEQQAEMDEIEAVHATRPSRWLQENVALDSRWCLIHGTQLASADIAALAETGLTFALCPVTEASLGDGIFDASALIEAGGHFGVGTDSNIRIGLQGELRMLEYSQRLRDQQRAVLADQSQSTGRFLYEHIVRGGARALGRDAGCIAVGQHADLLALDCSQPDLADRSGDVLMDSFIFVGDDRMIGDVWAGGRHLVQNGRHIHADDIVAHYRTTMAHLMALL